MEVKDLKHLLKSDIYWSGGKSENQKHSSVTIIKQFVESLYLSNIIISNEYYLRNGSMKLR